MSTIPLPSDPPPAGLLSSQTRLAATVLTSVLLSVGIAACGSSGSTTSSAKSSTTTTPTTTPPTTTTTTPAGPAHAKTHPKPTHATRHRTSAHKKQTTPAKSQTTTTAATTRTTTTTPAKTQTTTTPAKTHTGGPTVPPLPAPVVSGSAGGMHATLHGENHAPTVNKFWHYSVLATDASGHPLSGTVDTEFVFSGQVVGREAPPTHQLSHGRLNDKVTFPAQSVGVPLTFQVVVHTQRGTVTLDWAIKPHR